MSIRWTTAEEWSRALGRKCVPYVPTTSQIASNRKPFATVMADDSASAPMSDEMLLDAFKSSFNRLFQTIPGRIEWRQIPTFYREFDKIRGREVRRLVGRAQIVD